MIIQNVGHDGTTDFSFTVNRGDYAKAKKDAGKRQGAASARVPSPATTRSARFPRSASACAPTRASPARCSGLAEEGINIQMISTSEIKISVVVDEKYLELAVRVLHKAFGLDQ
jgi:aspartate kinase